MAGGRSADYLKTTCDNKYFFHKVMTHENGKKLGYKMLKIFYSM